MDMNIKSYELWESISENSIDISTISVYIPSKKVTDMAVVILPGGGYCELSPSEGDEYARFFNSIGISAFVCKYRVNPYNFPFPLLDARRAVRFVRYYADEFGINKSKILLIGSSAGGHLAALTSTYYENFKYEGIDDIDKEDYIPNAHVLCYPVINISIDETVSHVKSSVNFLGVEKLNLAHKLTPHNNISTKTPPCFIWHTFNDNVVNVTNSIHYVEALKRYNIPCEFHIFPDGRHGLGLSEDKDDSSRHVSQWKDLLINWIKYIGLF